MRTYLFTVEGRFVRLGEHGYGQVQIGGLCLVVRPGVKDIGAPVYFDYCGEGDQYEWVPGNYWRAGMTLVTLRSRHNGLCIGRGEDNFGGYVQKLCDSSDRSQMIADAFAAGLIASAHPQTRK